MFCLRSVAVLSDVTVILLSSIAVLTQNGNFLVVPLLRSVSDIWGLYSFEFLSGSKHVHSAGPQNLNLNVLPLPDRSQNCFLSFFLSVFLSNPAEARSLQSAVFGH